MGLEENSFEGKNNEEICPETNEKEEAEKRGKYDVRELTIDRAYHAIRFLCAREGQKTPFRKGACKESSEYRIQLDSLSVRIDEPWTKPLAVSIPENSGVFPITNEEKIWEYFHEYLATNTKGDKEDYTYGEYIEPQWNKAMEILLESDGYTNQCYITIGGPETIDYDDPPCLRGIDFKVVTEEKSGIRRLNMHVNFRSWDLYAGFPENIAGLQLLKEKMLIDLDDKGLKLEDGAIIASSSGAHFYSYALEQANKMLAVKFPIEKKEEDSEEEIF